jgi:hypothetical protein
MTRSSIIRNLPKILLGLLSREDEMGRSNKERIQKSSLEIRTLPGRRAN